jgi:ABC-2 type transport system permease protein
MSRWNRHFVRELRRVFTDRRIVLTMLVGPFLYGLLFGGVYMAGRIRHVPIVIVDQDNSALSRDLTAALLSSENLSLAFYADSTDAFYRAARRDQAYACVVIPENFQRDVVRGAEGKVSLILDGSNILTGNMTSRTISGTIAFYRVGARARRLIASGSPRPEADATALPIRPVIRPLNNPTSNYGFFVLVGLVLIAIQQVTRMGTAISLNLESEESAKGSDSINTIGGGNGLILSAKLAATAVMVLPVACIAIQIPFALFGGPFRGSWTLAYSLLIAFVLMQILIGYGIAGVFRSALASLQFLLFISVPLFMLTGFTWPAYVMPRWLQTISWLIPLTHLLDIFRKMALMGAGFRTLWPHFAIVAAWLPLSALWAYWSLKVCLKRVSLESRRSVSSAGLSCA